MNKFRGPQDANFKLVSGCLRNFADHYPVLLENRQCGKYSRNSSSSPAISGHVSGAKVDTRPQWVNVYWNVPRAVNSLFTGRVDELKKIEAALSPHVVRSDLQRRFVITGDGGQGKSEICLRIADMVRDKYVYFRPSPW
jgi:hypothetical protein